MVGCELKTELGCWGRAVTELKSPYSLYIGFLRI